MPNFTQLARAPWVAPAALALALGSVAVNAALLWRLREPERVVAPAMERVLARLEAQDASIRYTVRIPAGTPLHFDVPIDERYRIRLNTRIPINTTVRVPVNTPFGDRTVNIPIRTTIPIRQDLPVHLRDTFRLRTQTGAEIVVPMEISVRDLPLDELRRSLDP